MITLRMSLTLFPSRRLPLRRPHPRRGCQPPTGTPAQGCERPLQPTPNENGPGGHPPGPGAAHDPLASADVGRLLPLGAVNDVELHRLTLGEGAESRALDSRVVDKDVLLARALD